jgi:hypothetical protein
MKKSCVTYFLTTWLSVSLVARGHLKVQMGLIALFLDHDLDEVIAADLQLAIHTVIQLNDATLFLTLVYKVLV